MKNSLILSGLVALLIACQKEIDVDLNDANARIVIEANYTAEDSTVRVLITKTTSFFDNETTPTIDNATVTISDYTGATQTVLPLGNGMYELTNYIPIYSSTYTMNVIIDGITYTAGCDMAPPTQLADLTYDFINFFGATGYAVNLRFFDPADTVNHYFVIYSKNGVVRSELGSVILQDDIVTDGNFLDRPLFLFEDPASQNDPPILPDVGDSIGFELRSVDGKVYDYYNQALSILGSGQSSAAPANPNPFWSNDALGYFSAYSVSKKGVVIN